MKIKYLFCIIFILSATVAKAQQSNQLYIDSLKQKIFVAKEDTNKVHLLNQLGDLYTQTYADTGVTYSQQALDLAEKINFERGILDAELNLATSLEISGNYPLALDHSFKFLSLAKKLNDTTAASIANATLGYCYYDQGEYNTSLRYYFENLRLAEAIHAEKIHYALANMAHVYQSLNQPDSAMLYATKAYKRVKDSNDTLFVFNILGDAYAGKSNYDSALFFYRINTALSLKNHLEMALINSYNGIASVYKEKYDFDSAAEYSKKVLLEKIERSYPVGLLKAANMLTDIYELQNKPDSTLKYLRIADNVKDSLFSREKTNAAQTVAFKEQEKQKEIEAAQLKIQNRLRTYFLIGGLLALLIIAVILLRNNRTKKKAYLVLQNQKLETDTQKLKAEQAFIELKSTQSQLIQSEKMASLGELTAGIAHEIQNPLNFVNNFSEVNKEMLAELNEEIDKGNYNDAKEIAKDVIANEEKINHHGKRADAIVKGMLQHSRQTSGTKEPTDINALADEYLRLSYHGLRAKDKNFNADFKTDFDDAIGKINIIPQDIGRVLLNLCNNAFYAVQQKQKESVSNEVSYEPAVSVSTKKIGNKIEIKVSDNGSGIPQKIVDKIFQPFFTTKPTGQGTGLGLSLSYDIIKAHGGEIKVETKEGDGTKFIITLPKTSPL